MSSTQVDRPGKVVHHHMGGTSSSSNNSNAKKESEKSRKLFNGSHKKHNNKHEESRHFKFGRKRLQSFTANGKFFPPYKRRKNEGIIPPTKFLLGGNICDPLNLNSMQDEEINRAMNAVTPKSSPLPTPKHRKETIEVIIPPNICDPLNLSNCNDNEEEYEKQLISPTKKGGTKRRNRKRKRASSGSGKDEGGNDSLEAPKTEETPATSVGPEMPPEVTEVPAVSSETKIEISAPPETAAVPALEVAKTETKLLESPTKDRNKLRLKGLDDLKDKRLRKIDLKDKIVSPVIPQPGAWKPRIPHLNNPNKKKKQQQQQQQPTQMPNFRIKDARYQYGNYNRYYGYRNPHHDVDTRLTVFSQRQELFRAKDVLDIGCNIGHITLSVARDFAARSVTGIDIDRKLIGIARKNVKHYVNCVSSPASNDEPPENQFSDPSFFPLSMPINYGPIDVPGFTKNEDDKGFPYNVTFVQGNYVLEDDALLVTEQPQFDTILCLSITKWIHLNFGDAGLKQAFKRMHAQLRPGGVLVLEPQGWASYGKKKNLTERTYKTYQSIEFFPQKFTQYLLSPEVGFDKCEVVSIPAHPSKGFQRPIQLFTKAGSSPTSTASTPGTLRATTTTTVTSTSTTTTGTTTCSNSLRFVDREVKRKDRERRAFERDLFPNEFPKFGNCSNLSQRSSESLSQYEHLANVYAPSATPCYDTPSHNAEYSQPYEPGKMCYVEVNNLASGQENPANIVPGNNFENLLNIATDNNSSTEGSSSQIIPPSTEGNAIDRISDEETTATTVSDEKSTKASENPTIKVSGDDTGNVIEKPPKTVHNCNKNSKNTLDETTTEVWDKKSKKVAEITMNETLSDNSERSTEKSSNATSSCFENCNNSLKNTSQVLSDKNSGNSTEKSSNAVPVCSRKTRNVGESCSTSFVCSQSDESELQTVESSPADNRRNEMSNNFPRKRKIDETRPETLTKPCNGESSQSCRNNREISTRAKSPSNILSSQKSSNFIQRDSSVTNHQRATSEEPASGFQSHSSALDPRTEKT